MAACSGRVAFQAVITLLFIVLVSGWNIALEITTQLDGAVGGEPFVIQPSVIVNNKKGEHQSAFEGRVSVQLNQHDDELFVPVWKEGWPTPTENNINTLISQNVIDGRVHFNGLGIDTAGDYQLKFILYDEHDLVMTTTIGDNFTVNVGEAHQLGIITHPESALGGTEFGIQPIVSVQDRGGNTVENVNDGVVSVSLLNGLDDSTLRSVLDEDGFEVSIKDGVAQFEGLFINEAALEYSLHFSTDLNLVGTSEVTSNTFSVGIGPAAKLHIVQDASDGSVIGGKAFASQPRLEVKDVGGNVLKYDSSSAIRVSIYIDPSYEGTLSPSDQTTVILKEGIVQYTRLAIDKAGYGYRLKYEFLQHDGMSSFNETAIFILGSYFNVEIGPPHRLSILQHSSGGWAGNQPFLIQPKVALVDAGGNVVSSDSSSVVTAHLTPSLAFDSKVIINTSNDATSSIVHAEFAETIKYDGRTLYGPGDVIRINVIFDQEVTIFPSTGDEGNLPILILNAAADAYAELIHESQQYGSLSDKLSFEYVVQEGHSQPELDYLSHDSLLSQDCSIEDAFGRNANLIMPALGTGQSLSSSKAIGISDSRPTIDSISVDVPSGEYGAGQIINFSVSFDREVIVTGNPLLPLNATRAATYTSGSGTNALHFEFRVAEGDNYLERLEIPVEPDVALMLPSHQDTITLLTNGAEPSPITADLIIGEMTNRYTQSIVIDTNPPTVIGISPKALTTPDGTYAVGDVLQFEVLFDKSVEVSKGLELTLSNGGVAQYVSGSGTATILLQYTVKEGETSSNLGFKDAMSLIAQNTEGGRLPVAGHVRRASTYPTTDANLNLTHTSNFDQDYVIQIDGERPRMIGVSFDSSDEGGELIKGDVLTIMVSFSAPIVVKDSSPPLLGLLLGERKRWATYASGSGSSILKFDYQVSIGDDLLSPHDFKYTRICTHDKDCINTDGLVVRLSETLAFDANISDGFSDGDNPIAESTQQGVTIDTSQSPASTVVAVSTSKASGTYGAGEIIDFHIKFSDEVFIFGIPPIMWLNTDREADYHAGNETDTLVFRYVSSTADSIHRLDWSFYEDSDSSIGCNEGCMIKNANEVAVDTTFRDADNNVLWEPLVADIMLDPSPPQIMSVETDKVASPYCYPICSYTVGEEVRISVTFDKPVIVSGHKISLEMNVTDDSMVDNSSRAIYQPIESSSLQLIFLYTVGYNHTSHGKGLGYICNEINCSIEISQEATIKRAATNPMVDADLTLPALPEHGISADVFNPIIVDTSGLPTIMRVHSNNPDDKYSPGDIIEIAVVFSKGVVVVGEPFLILDVGISEAGIATYKDGSGSSTLYFEYRVGDDHMSLDLDYIDAHSLHVGFDGVHPGSIKQTSTNPTVDANIDLPTPGSDGSLGFLSNIQIDSRRPYINRVSTVSGEYVTGDKIVIQVAFSRPVVIQGNLSLLLETGNVNRVAEYESQPSDYLIDFVYTVRLGDTSDNLNYWSTEELLPSSKTSLRLSDGWIRLKSANPQLDADLHINPVDGYLDGDVVCSVTDGVAIFRELKIGQRGSDFKIWFQSKLPGGEVLETVETIKIDASIEYEVQGDLTNRDEGDLYGSVVSLDNDILAVGAPGKRNPSPEVQVLTVYSEAIAEEENEIQIISTSVNVSQAIRTSQEFSTCADPQETILGTFKLTYIIDNNYTYASPIEVDADVSAEQLKTMLENTLNLRGLIDTARTANPACQSRNGWVWSVTFFDSSNGVGIIKTDGYSLIGMGASISEATLTRQLDMLSGSFVLVNSVNGLSSRELPYDASSSVLKDAIEQDLLIAVKSVQSEDTHGIPELGRLWTIIFSHFIGEHGRDVDIPLLHAIYENLQGHDAQVWTHTGLEGRGALNGTFAMSFRGSNPSHFVSHNSSEIEIKSALESLDSINEVLVTNREEFRHEAGKSGISWIITFQSVNKLTDYGWVLDPEGSSSEGNLPPLRVVSQLTGWNAGFEVRSETGMGEGDTQAQWMEQEMGDDGKDSGAVEVYRRVREIWQKEASLLASDFDSKDAFGTSVSVKGDFLLVGAPSKQVNGLPEQQTLTCKGPATGGFFVLQFRGFQSSPIPHSANVHEIKKLVEGMYGETSQIHSIPRLILSSSSENWDGVVGGFCDGNEERSIAITFLTPDGGGISTVEKRSGDLEDLSVDSSKLVGACIMITESRSGTNSPMGRDLNMSHPTGKQAGSVYLFQRNKACNVCSATWSQSTKFTPIAGLDHPTDAARFGHSVVFVPETDTSTALAIIGSPGYNHELGKVYIFHYDHTQGSWEMLDSLTDSNWNHIGDKGGRFGSSLHVDGDTLLVGSPGYSSGKGAVYIFRRSQNGKHFLASQAIYGPSDIEEGDNFGHSLSLSENKAVICAPYKSVPILQVISSDRILTPNAGACHVYSRRNEASSFLFDEQLMPSNILPRDRFGWDVSISGSRIVVGQVEKSDEIIGPPRPVQIIQTFCQTSSCESEKESKFKLYWSDGDGLHETRYLSSSVSASQLRSVIETNLNIGDVTVDRSIQSDKDGGHEWYVTFDSYKHFRDVKVVPNLQCEMLIASKLSCKVRIENEFPRRIRSKAHLFDFDSDSMTWKEQAFLSPTNHQIQDNMGSSVVIDGSRVAVGAPNREWLNVNSGAAFLFDVSFLDLRFSDEPYTVVEGETKLIELERSDLDRMQLVSLRTADRNAEDDFLFYVNELYSLQALGLTPHEFLLSSSTAFGRSQFYGSDNQCSRYVRGIYDFQGVSDYAPLKFEALMKPGEDSISTVFVTNNDTIVEKPDEHTTIQVNLRGMFASSLGRLTTNITIEGSNDESDAHYEILGKDAPPDESARMGAAVAIDRRAGMIIVGSDQSRHIDKDGKYLKNIGSAQIFKRMSDGSWTFLQELIPPSNAVETEMKFGSSVAIHKPYGRDDITVLVGAPGIAAAYVFVFQSSTNSFAYQATLSPQENSTVPLSELRFGGANAIALQGDVAFVGSSFMEAVYVFRRSYVQDEGFISWDPYSILRSSDYDYDVFGHNFTVRHIHHQNFGVAVTASGRSLLVGAPFADYGNRGNVGSRERFDTDGIHNPGLGKGRVYAFFSQPHTQIITLQSDEIISSGSFRLQLLNHRGVQGEENSISGLIRYNASPSSFKLAMEEIAGIGEVDAEISEEFQSGVYTFRWRVTFINNFEDEQPNLVPLWEGNGCQDCDRFIVSVLSTVPPFLNVQIIHSHQPFQEEYEMQPEDVVSTDLFGATLSLDGPQGIIGSMHSAARTRTVWDFETGDLHGWISTGDAFRYQPTFGDNSKFRPVYEGYGSNAAHPEGNPQTSHLVGNYYIGTFEKRPTREHSMGATQGDEPTGTLTSEPFLCLGESISFRIGGGCNHLKVYVELLVDGYPSLRATGKCHEGMDKVHWDVSTFTNRACQIRIVDHGTDKWGHINVDNFDFDWNMVGTCRSNNFGQCFAGAEHYARSEETPTSGAAYLFIRECPQKEFDDMTPSNVNCTWTEQERIVASDKREGNQFGISVDIDHEHGVAIVGSTNSPAYGFYNDPIFVHPHSNLTTVDMPIPENLQDMMRSGGTYSATGGNLRVIDHLIHQEHIPVKERMRYTEQAGSTYVFIREPAEIGPSGEVIRKPFWKTTEDSKFAPPDIAARDHFGSSVAMDGSTAVVGATGDDSFAKNGGGTFLYDMEWIRVKFSKVEFVALEGSDHVVKIFLERDLSWSNSTLTIGYSTSDLTAIGVDSLKFDECLQSPVSQRDGCGDYEQTDGEVTFRQGEEQTYFTIRVIDDHCIERRLEYVQLNLHQLGGSPLRGENYRAQLRIDDNDWMGGPFSHNCTNGIT